MTNSSSRKPGFFSKLWRLQKSAVARFPALFVLGIVTAVTMALGKSSYPLTEAGWTDEYELFRELMNRLAYTGVWGMLFSVIAQLLVEIRHGRRVQIAAQAIIFALSIFALPLLFVRIYGERRDVLLVGVTLALCAIILFILTRTQGSDIAFPNFIVSVAIAGFSSLCVLVISWLINTTLIDELWEMMDYHISFYLEYNILNILINLPLYVLFPMIFITLATREREQISLPFAYQFIALRILIMNGILFLALLYLYLFKLLFTDILTFIGMCMSGREIFLYTSFATSGHLFFYFASMPDESPFFVFFRRYGALFMLPLVAMQIFAFVIKIYTEGYTPARAAALLYIIFSIASCALTFIKRGKYMPLTFLIFAVLCILGSSTPLNIIDIAK